MNHPNKEACLELTSQRVKAPHPVEDRTIEGIVVGYDPRPYKQIDGDYVVIRPDMEEGAVTHPAWVTVEFAKITRLPAEVGS